MEKLRIKNLGNIVLLGGAPELDKEYLLSIRIARSGVSRDERDKENPIDVYVCEYLATEQLAEIGSSKKIGFQKGRTQSQMLRWSCIDVATSRGIDSDEYYKSQMSKYIEEQKAKLDG